MLEIPPSDVDQWLVAAFDPETEERIRKYVEPSANDVVRAEMALLDVLADGTARSKDGLLASAIVRLGAPASLEPHSQAVNVEHPDLIDPQDPVLSHHRMQRAATLALRRLERSDVVMRVDPNQGTRVGARTPSIGSSVEIGWASVELGGGYQLVDPTGDGRIREPNLFLDGLDDLGLDARSQRCLEEALTCYRRRLYLSCVNLLGAVNEAAWYASGEKHPRPDPGLQQALANDRTAEVLKRVSAWLKDGARDSDKIRIDEMYAQAGVMRDPQLRRTPQNHDVIRSRGVLHRERERTTPSPLEVLPLAFAGDDDKGNRAQRRST